MCNVGNENAGRRYEVSGETMKTRNVFQTAFLVSLMYHFFWLAARHYGWVLSNNFNIPSFFLFVSAIPWTYIAMEAGEQVRDVFGVMGKSVVLIFLSSLGFALNIVIIKIVVCFLFEKLRKST